MEIKEIIENKIRQNNNRINLKKKEIGELNIEFANKLKEYAKVIENHSSDIDVSMYMKGEVENARCLTMIENRLEYISQLEAIQEELNSMLDDILENGQSII